MGTRAVRHLALLVAALGACTAPPEPPTGSPGPKLDPQAIAYDNLDFNLSRPEVFDNTCETLPSNLQSLLGLEKKPYTGTGRGCHGRGGVGHPLHRALQPRRRAEVEGSALRRRVERRPHHRALLPAIDPAGPLLRDDRGHR